MATIESLIAKVRLELGDEPLPFIKTDVGNGSQTVFNTDYFPLKSDLIVKINNVVVTTYTADLARGIITFNTAPANNAAIVVTGNHFKWFSDDSVTSFIDTALLQQLGGRVGPTGYAISMATMAEIEVHPAVILASIEGLWALATDAAFDIDIHTPEGVTIPRSQRYHQLMLLIEAKKGYYKEISQLLGIGLYAVEVFNVRRVAMKTGRLVPLYLPREVEDSTPPIRVYVAGSSYGGSVKVSDNAIYDITTVQDTVWSEQFDFPFSLADYTLTAQVRLYAGSPVILAQISCVITDAPNGIATLSLTRAQTLALPERGVWDLKATGISDPTWSDVFIEGRVYVTRRITT